MLPETPGADENQPLGALSQLQQMRGIIQPRYEAAQAGREQSRSALDEHYQAAMDELKKPVRDNSWLHLALGALQPSWSPMGSVLSGAQSALAEQERVGALSQERALGASKLGAEWQRRKMEDYGSEAGKLLAQLGRTSGAGVVGKWVSRPLDDGSIYMYNNVTQESKVIPASGAKNWEAARRTAYEKAIAEQMEDPEQYAFDYANRVVPSIPRVQLPGNVAPQQRQAAVGVLPSARKSQVVGVIPSQLPQEVQDELNRQIARLQANPNDPVLRENTLRRLKELAAKYPQASGAVSGTGEIVQQPVGEAPDVGFEAPPARSIRYKDKPAAAMEEATATETGKSLGKTFEDYQTASHNSSTFKMHLDKLKQLFSNPNIPEGRLGEGIQSFRSGMTSLGLLDKDEAKTVADADMVSAIGGKLALLTRTAEGGNLMPGAMSDFEQRVLRSLAPGLNQTREGRMQLIEFLSEMADVRVRLAAEATKAAGERGILPPSWYARRDRVLKEEQARLLHKAKQLGAIK